MDLTCMNTMYEGVGRVAHPLAHFFVTT